MQPAKKLASAILVIAAIGLLACFHKYYKTNTVATTDETSLQALIAAQKFFILHSGTQAYALTNPRVQDGSIEGDLANLPQQHEKYLYPKHEEGNRFKVKDRQAVLYEVHLYTVDSLLNGTHVRVPVKDISRLDAYNLDKNATTGSTVLSIVGVTVATAVVVLIVGSATTSWNYGGGGGGGGSVCSPKVYLMDKDERHLTGILYSGAIFAPLQRTDYLPLPDAKPVDGQLRLQVRPSPNEELYIHDVALLRVTHPVGENVLVDRYGHTWSWHNIVKPFRASDGSGIDHRQDLADDDGRSYSFTTRPQNQPYSSIVLDFKKPVGAGSARLIVKARNSSWGAYIFREFKALYGEYYPTLMQIKDKGDKQQLLQCEIDQSMPLSVSVQHAGEWKPADFFFTIGNDASRYMIMNLDLSGLENEDHVSVQLHTAYQFWDVDFAALDYSTTVAPETALIPGRSAAHITDKETLDLDFTIPAQTRSGYADSWFLVGTGYYHDNTHYPGKPQLGTLGGFASKGAFDKFSRAKFDDLMLAIRNGSKKDLTTAN